MQKIIEKVIESRNYELSDILKKIDTLWVQGDISEDARKRLADLARNNANMQNSMDILAKLEELDKRVKALEAQAETEEPTEDTESYEEYVSGKWCYNGDIFAFKGKIYKCIAPEGVTCVWTPEEYPTYWEEMEQPL